MSSLTSSHAWSLPLQVVGLQEVPASSADSGILVSFSNVGRRAANIIVCEVKVRAQAFPSRHCSSSSHKHQLSTSKDQLKKCGIKGRLHTAWYPNNRQFFWIQRKDKVVYVRCSFALKSAIITTTVLAMLAVSFPSVVSPIMPIHLVKRCAQLLCVWITRFMMAFAICWPRRLRARRTCEKHQVRWGWWVKATYSSSCPWHSSWRSCT